ncbi:sialoadhesin-like isoform X1 [Centroberyx affinis]|uniref:sialoadhesin-like isoform X1 n=1 Tax=Centroberyx affinis TaxID=166261 RepID=UPI003A5BD398
MKKTLLLVLLLNMLLRSAHSHASLAVSPSRSQWFEYERVSLSCEQTGSDGWRVRRYTADGLKVSSCGQDWGSSAAARCVLNTVKHSDSGVYWCESELGESSSTVNITVTGGAVILQSPVLPVMEGAAVTLNCTTKTPSNLPAGFYKDGSLIRTESTGQMTIHHVSKSDEGLYKCHISGPGESPPSWLLMEAVSPPASLTVTPGRSQLFEYERLSLSCEEQIGWRVRRSGPTGGRLSACGDDWGSPTASGCSLLTTKRSDSATYWCESATGQRSTSANITVHDGAVILQSPVLPVMEGAAVTLNCTTKTPSNLPAGFYKDGSLIRTESTGQMTIHHVSKSDEGLYKCHISGPGESPPSWLAVRAPPPAAAPPPPPAPLLSTDRLVRHLVVFCPYCISTLLMLSMYCHRPGGNDPPVSTATAPPGQADGGLDVEHGDVIADVTTEHHF